MCWAASRPSVPTTTWRSAWPTSCWPSMPHGQERTAIAQYADALKNGDAASIGNATIILNGVCAQS